MRAFLATFFLAVLTGVGWPYRESAGLTPADLAFFFTSVRMDGSSWVYQLSPSTRGMLWRIRDGKSDVTGACESGEDLEVKRSASLEIKNAEVKLAIFWRYGVGVMMREAVLKISASPKEGAPAEELSAYVHVMPGDHLGLVHVKE